ncbi:MAG: DUF1320 family protein [Bacteroidales bacterium]|jgi:phage gp36-like protein|nr:DUF1320 family protein [Bacteroidales bacterium]
MIYINKEDLIDVIYERLLLESVAASEASALENSSIIISIEKKVIDFVNSYISGHYDKDKIFNTEAPIRNGVLTQIIASIVAYRCVRRNAARKVPEDLVQLYTDAKRDLERIQKGAMTLVGCPLVADETDETTHVIYGNTTNEDFFI